MRNGMVMTMSLAMPMHGNVSPLDLLYQIECLIGFGAHGTFKALRGYMVVTWVR